MTSTQQWNELVRNFEEEGHSPQSAVQHARASNPTLHRRMLAEINGPRHTAVQAPSGPAAVEQFNAVVQTLVEAGLPKLKAISRVVKTQPAIYKAMLAAANARRR